MNEARSINKNVKFFIYLILILFASFYVIVHSYSTSFLYSFQGRDSAFFQTIGKYWCKGIVPYKELFDSKGPIIFLINAIGYSFGIGRFGVLVLQIVSFTIFVLLMFSYISKKQPLSTSVLLTIGIAIILDFSYGEGNFTEEYILPLLMLSAIGIDKWFDSHEDKVCVHSPFWAFIYGITFGFAAFTRITNAITVCVAVAVITIVLLSKKQLKNLISNILLFMTGFLIIAIPFTVYFILKNSLYDFLFGTFLYNLSYKKESGSAFFSQSPIELAKDIFAFSGCFFLLFSGFMKFKKDSIRAVIYIFEAFSLICLFITSYDFPHYYIISVPCFSVALSDLDFSFHNSSFPRKALSLFCLLFFLFASFCGIRKTVSDLNYYRSHYPEDKITILDTVRKDIGSSFIGYNVQPDLYLTENIDPSFKYFTLQDWVGGMNWRAAIDIENSFYSQNISWVLLGEHSWIIDGILQEKYKLVSSQTVNGICYELYHLE